MSAFLKIPMQFLILLIGVLVFVFYQFRPPPMIFNEVDAAALPQRSRLSTSDLKPNFRKFIRIGAWPP